MRKLQTVIVSLIILNFGIPAIAFTQTEDPPEIDNPNSEPIQYCSDAVAVVPFISIKNLQVDEDNEGIKISISPYLRDEDILEWDEVDSFKYNWNVSSGYLEISGPGTNEAYEEAVSKVYYKNVSGVRTTGIRSFSISLKDADYLPATGHFYRFVPGESITWRNARAQANSLDYYGLQGYLATIRYKQEQDFIYTKTEGTGWIGASDAEEEGKWKWVEGPDAGIYFWEGNAGGSSVNGEYNNWGAGEPNNSGDEDYAHILYSVGVRGDWNDLANPGSGVEGYIPQGFLIEFGGMKGDPEVKLSAVAFVEVKDSERPEIDENKFISLFCGGKSHELNIEFLNVNPEIQIIALDSGMTVENENTYNPVLTVAEYGKSNLKVIMTDNANCEYLDTLQIGIHNQPEAIFNLDSNECYGYNLQLAYTGINFEETEYTWYYNDSEFNSGVDLDSINIPLGFTDEQRFVSLKVNEQGCTAVSPKREVKVKPDIIVSAENVAGCSPITVNFFASTNKPAQSYFWDFGNGLNSSEQNPLQFYDNPSDNLLPFNVNLTVRDENNCENTAVYDSLIQVYPVPVAGFTFSPEEALITDPEVSFSNTSHAATNFYWDFGDSTFSEQIDPIHRYSAMDIYNVFLKVENSYNCADSMMQQVIVTFDKLFPPNAFSPNATLEEDQVFRIYGQGVIEEGYQLLIFNRWGEVIFESLSQDNGWDGTMQSGNFAPAGVYTWVLQYTDFTGEKHKQQGNVTLLF